MERLNDPTVMMLPHPVRVDAAVGKPADTLMFETMGVMSALRPYLTDAHVSTEWILNRVAGMREIAVAHLSLLGDANMGSFMLTMVRARLRAHGDPMVQVTPALQTMLAETDLAAELPARFFRSPYPLVFVEFARPNSLRVPNQVSGLHECEGAYVGTYELAAHDPFFCKADRNRALNLDPSKPVRVLEIVIIGSPVGKANALDDASQDLVLAVQDEDECLATLLDRHIAWFNNPVAYAHPSLKPVNPAEVALVKPTVYELAKVLLYMNLPEAEQQRITERGDLEKRLRGLGPQKAAKLKRKLVRAYDRILIGPSTLSGVAPPSHQTPVGERHVRPHWRRGHFRRIRYGEGLSESRLGWIQPVLVNAAELTAGVVKTKPYVVR